MPSSSGLYHLLLTGVEAHIVFHRRNKSLKVFFLFKRQLPEKLGAVEVGPWQVYGVPRQIVLLLQAVASLVEVGANGLSRKAPYVVLKKAEAGMTITICQEAGAAFSAKGSRPSDDQRFTVSSTSLAARSRFLRSAPPPMSICPAQLHSML